MTTIAMRLDVWKYEFEIEGYPSDLDIIIYGKSPNPDCPHCEDRHTVYVNGNEYHCAFCLASGSCEHPDCNHNQEK